MPRRGMEAPVRRLEAAQTCVDRVSRYHSGPRNADWEPSAPLVVPRRLQCGPMTPGQSRLLRNAGNGIQGAIAMLLFQGPARREPDAGCRVSFPLTAQLNTLCLACRRLPCPCLFLFYRHARAYVIYLMNGHSPVQRGLCTVQIDGHVDVSFWLGADLWLQIERSC